MLKTKIAKILKLSLQIIFKIIRIRIESQQILSKKYDKHFTMSQLQFGFNFEVYIIFIRTYLILTLRIHICQHQSKSVFINIFHPEAGSTSN